MKSTRTFIRAFSSLGILSLLLFSSCDGTKEEKKTDCPCEEHDEVKEPKGIIDREQAAVLFKGYSEKREDCAMEGQDSTFIPARYTEFKFEVIKDYIKYIEQEAKTADKKIETLRIYYAVYPEGRGIRSNKTTVFLVPSADFNGENKAFQISMEGERIEADTIPWDFGTGAKKMSMHFEQDQRQYATFGPLPASSAPVQDYRSLVLNDGSTAPPPYH